MFPVLANISAVQVRDGDLPSLLALVQRLEAQALVVHLNAGQELFQPEGDRDFRGLKQAIARLCEASPVPVIVKETGFGIVPSLVRELLAGRRGLRRPRRRRGHQLGDRGVLPRFRARTASSPPSSPTGVCPRPLLLAACRTGRDRAAGIRGDPQRHGRGQGGRHGRRPCRAWRCPVIRCRGGGGAEAVVKLYRRLEKTLRIVMLMTGSRTTAELRGAPCGWTRDSAAAVESFLRAASRATPGSQSSIIRRGDES